VTSYWNGFQVNIMSDKNNKIKRRKNYLKYGLLNRNGDPIYIGKETVHTYKREKLGFNEYFKERYTDKPFIFLISLAIIGLLSFLLNDKIKAR
jgi:hypothetical protein